MKMENIFLTDLDKNFPEEGKKFKEYLEQKGITPGLLETEKYHKQFIAETQPDLEYVGLFERINSNIEMKKKPSAINDVELIAPVPEKPRNENDVSVQIANMPLKGSVAETLEGIRKLREQSAQAKSKLENESEFVAPVPERPSNDNVSTRIADMPMKGSVAETLESIRKIREQSQSVESKNTVQMKPN